MNENELHENECEEELIVDEEATTNGRGESRKYRMRMDALKEKSQRNRTEHCDAVNFDKGYAKRRRPSPWNKAVKKMASKAARKFESTEKGSLYKKDFDSRGKRY